MNIGKPLNRHFAKEDSWMINKYMKNCSASFVNKVMQAKTTLRSHYKRARLAKPTDTFGWWQGCATTAVLAPGDVSHATASRGKSFIVSSEVKHLHYSWPRNCFPGYLCKRNENACPQRDLYKTVHSSFIHNNPNWKHPDVHRRRGRQIVFPHHGITQRSKRTNYRYTRQLECISDVVLTSGGSQTQKSPQYMIPCIWGSRIKLIYGEIFQKSGVESRQTGKRYRSLVGSGFCMVTGVWLTQGD